MYFLTPENEKKIKLKIRPRDEEKAFLAPAYSRIIAYVNLVWDLRTTRLNLP